MRRVTFSKAAARTLRRMPANTSKLIVGKIKLYASEPQSLAANVKPLRGMPGVLRLRVGDWRILFTEDLEVMAILAIAARGEAYRQG